MTDIAEGDRSGGDSADLNSARQRTSGQTLVTGMSRRVAVIVALALVMIVGSAQLSPAHAAGPPRPRAILCNPEVRKAYCNPDRDRFYAQYLNEARADARRHTSKKWRQGVPYPSQAMRNHQGWGAVYVITAAAGLHWSDRAGADDLQVRHDVRLAEYRDASAYQRARLQGVAEMAGL